MLVQGLQELACIVGHVEGHYLGYKAQQVIHILSLLSSRMVLLANLS